MEILVNLLYRIIIFLQFAHIYQITRKSIQSQATGSFAFSHNINGNKTVFKLNMLMSYLVTWRQGTSRFLAQGGADAPPWLRQGGAFWSQGRASRFFKFLQITWFFLNAVLLLYLKLFTCLEIITMLKWSFEILNDFILSCSAQVIISQEVAKWLKKPAQGKHFEILFF